MLDKETRKSFGERLKRLRKRKGWTQKELSAKVEIGFSQFNKYEMGLHIPQLEKLIRLAELLDTSLDYLLTGDKNNKSSLHNTRLLKRFQALEKFDADEQEATIKFLDAMIMKNQMQGIMTPLDNQ